MRVIRTEHEVESRKLHFCDECNGMILSGHKYVHAVAVDNSTIFDYRMCMKCAGKKESIKRPVAWGELFNALTVEKLLRF